MGYLKISTINVTGNTELIYYNKNPDICPLCHQHISPNILKSFEIIAFFISIIFQCPNSKCHRIFIGNYYKNTTEGTYSLSNLEPFYYKNVEISKEIVDISPTFYEIYNQALASENYNHEHLVGIGLRKSLEYLIKDYLVNKYPDKKEEIIVKRISNCINDYIDDPKLKACAKRAIWLGNDETHYMRKWLDKDIEDMKILVKLSLNWVESNILTDKYNSEMV